MRAQLHASVYACVNGYVSMCLGGRVGVRGIGGARDGGGGRTYVHKLKTRKSE